MKSGGLEYIMQKCVFLRAELLTIAAGMDKFLVPYARKQSTSERGEEGSTIHISDAVSENNNPLGDAVNESNNPLGDAVNENNNPLGISFKICNAQGN